MRYSRGGPLVKAELTFWRAGLQGWIALRGQTADPAARLKQLIPGKESQEKSPTPWAAVTTETRDGQSGDAADLVTLHRPSPVKGSSELASPSQSADASPNPDQLPLERLPWAHCPVDQRQIKGNLKRGFADGEVKW